MATYVFVHGGNMSTETWNRLTVGKKVKTQDGLMGGMIWDGTAAALKAAGHQVFAPTLEDENRSTLARHIGQVVRILEENDLHHVILVGHSYGGFVITGVADKVPERIRRLVYLDTGLPDPGESLYDLLKRGLAGDGGALPPLPDSNPPYVEKIRYDPENLRSLEKTYIRCMKSDFLPVTLFSKEKVMKEKGAWTYLELPSSHVPMADLPDAFNALMLGFGREGEQT